MSVSHCFRISMIFCGLLASSMLAANDRPHYLDVKTVPITRLLDGPPAADSAQTVREVGLVLQQQAARTGADVARITREGDWSPRLFDDVFGEWFTPETLPCTFALLDTAGHDTMRVCDRAKKRWFRARPSLVDQRIHPSVGLPKNSSYPSGHGAYGMVLAEILSELAPDMRSRLIERGKQIGDDRVMGGVHFPSDVEAGRTLAQEILRELRASPEFQADLEKACQELRDVRSRHAPAEMAQPAH